MTAAFAINGMPGAGKTALAVHVAHVLAGHFPDGQLFIDLQAHTPGHEPVKAADALAGLLAAMGADVRYLPGDLNERAAMWRDRLAGQRVLLVLDNAASSSQVAPLLPGAGGCLVLVTSRRHLGDLPGAVTPVLVDVLPPEKAADMFTRLAPLAEGDRDGVAELAGLAGFLPLAISLLARVLVRHPSWTLGDLIAETRARLLTLTAEHSSVAAAFEVSYRHLDPVLQQFFRLLGVHPGTVIDAYSAAALAGISPGDATGCLEVLYGEGLVTESGYRRYVMHDLIRWYARDLAAARDPATGQQALGRLLDYYQFAAARAEKFLARQARPGLTPAAPAGFEVPNLDNAGRALVWARAELASLLACLDLATRTGQHARVGALTAGAAAVLRRHGPWAEAVTRHAVAAGAARHLGDRVGEANALNDLGNVRQVTGDYPGAAGVLREALGIYRDLGDRLGEANALNDLGAVRRLTHDYPVAARAVEQALRIYRDLGDRQGEAEALNEQGTLHWARCDRAQAEESHLMALELARATGSSRDEACALAGLGRCAMAAGDTAQAAALLRQAQKIFQRIGAAEASDILADIGTLTRPESGR